MRIDTRPRKRNAPRPAEKAAPGFLQWLRGRECMVAPHPACEQQRLEAAHVDYAGGKGVGTKVADRWAVPLCSHHHREQHRIGWKTFERIYLIDCKSAAEQYWRAWPGRIAWERKQDAS